MRRGRPLRWTMSMSEKSLAMRCSPVPISTPTPPRSATFRSGTTIRCSRPSHRSRRFVRMTISCLSITTDTRSTVSTGRSCSRHASSTQRASRTGTGSTSGSPSHTAMEVTLGPVKLGVLLFAVVLLAFGTATQRGAAQQLVTPMDTNRTVALLGTNKGTEHRATSELHVVQQLEVASNLGYQVFDQGQMIPVQFVRRVIEPGRDRASRGSCLERIGCEEL
jgi:hypothetical protein